MNTMLNNLNKTLATLPEVINFEQFNDYIKIDTACPIVYCEESLVLYAKPINNGIFITDLKGTFEDAYLNGIPVQTLKETAEANGLMFDNNSVFTVTTIENLSQTLAQFFILIKQLDI